MARPRSVTDQEIIDAARRCFTEHGPSASLSAIGEQVGVTAAAILKRMGSKEALLKASLTSGDWAPPWLLELRSGPVEGPMKRQLVVTLDRAFTMLEQFLPSIVAIKLSGVEFLHDDKPAPPDIFRAELAAWIRRAGARDGFEAPSPEAASLLLVGAVQSAAFMAWARGKAAMKPDWGELIGTVLPELR